MSSLLLSDNHTSSSMKEIRILQPENANSYFFNCDHTESLFNSENNDINYIIIACKCAKFFI